MRRYSIFHPFYMSFYNKALYRDVATEWKTGTAFGYLLLLVIICSIPALVQIPSNMNDLSEREASEVIKKLPEVSIINGQFFINKPVPYIVDAQDIGQVVIFDTTGQIAPSVYFDRYSKYGKYSVITVVTDNQIIRKVRSGKPTVALSINQSDNTKLSRDDLCRYLKMGYHYLKIFLLIVTIPILFSVYVVEVLLLGLLGMLYSKTLKTNMAYSTFMRLSIISITPGALLSTIIDILNLKLHHPTTMFLLSEFFIAMIYLYFGVKVNADKQLRQAV